MTASAPTPQEDVDAKRAFQTYLNYIEAFRDTLRSDFDSWSDYCKACLQATRKLQGGITDERWLKRYLPLAWNTEYLLHRAPLESTDILRISNHWLPVQAYYAVYCASEAAGFVLDGSPPRSHAQALRTVTSYLLKSGVGVWKLGVEGNLGCDKKGSSVRNLPEGVRIPHNLERHGIEPIGMVTRCLLAEHKHRVDDGWSNKKQSGCYKYQYDPGPTGILHFLYRLRLKANYYNLDPFLINANERDIRTFTDALRVMAHSGLTYCEVIVLRKIGKQFLLDLADEYLNKNPSADHLKERLSHYSKFV